MSEKKPEHPAVKIAGIVSGFVFVIVLMVAVLAREYMSFIGWIVVPLALMGVGRAVAASKGKP